ncbi:hypothetical protein KY284_010717 [Solanum tuberosum]|nr:hypothetical protein KY284_010717 [Solanum tuberosum]
MGDYNAILKGDDRFNGNQVTDSETRDFNNFLLDNSLTEMKTVGRQYTWTNNHTHSKIDRIIVNAEWVQQWPHIKGVILERHFSDHCPLSVKMKEHDGKGPKPFRFYNYMAEHKIFITEVEESCNRRSAAKTMYEVWLKLKQMKVVMKNTAKKEFGNIEEKIIAARVALRNYQNTHTDPTRGQNQCHVEKQLKQELEKWILVEESIIQQKSRVQWLKKGDSNTSYFFACLKNRQAQNQIRRLITEDG